MGIVVHIHSFSTNNIPKPSKQNAFYYYLNKASMTHSLLATAGATFSSILYEVARNDGDLEGILLGSIVTRKKKIINDREESSFQETTTIVIESFVPTGKTFSFYGKMGTVDLKV